MEDVGNLTGIEAGDSGDQTSELGMAKERRHKMKFIGVIFRLFSATPEELHSDPHHLYFGDIKYLSMVGLSDISDATSDRHSADIAR